MISVNSNKAAQAIQDGIFKKMTADQKLSLAAGLWQLGREMSKDQEYGKNRSARIVGRDRRDSR